MDNSTENTEYQTFLLELIQLINRDNFVNREPRRQDRANRTHFSQGSQQNNRYQSAESIYRQQIYDIVTQYTRTIHEYQNNMRDYNDIVYYALEMLQSMRPNRNTNPSAHAHAHARNIPENTRNYLSNSAGFRGIFNTGTRATPFANIFSEPVIVRPTNIQISIATRTIQYSTDLSNNTRCPITLEEFQPDDMVCEIKHCRHLFKRDSIMDWFQRNVRCPVCRYDIRDYIEPPSNDTEDREEEEVPETEDENPFDIGNDAGPFLIDLSQNISRTPSPIRRQGSPRLNEIMLNTVNNQIDTIASNISSILHNYIDQETVGNNDISSNVFTFEIPIIYFDLSTNPYIQHM